jgi:hypothetical protein
MEPTTPEERLTIVENLLQTLTESQIQQQETLLRLEESQARTDQQVQTLVTIVSKVSDSQERTAERLLSLIDTVDRIIRNQQVTDDKLHALIDTVDRIIRRGI